MSSFYEDPFGYYPNTIKNYEGDVDCKCGAIFQIALN